MIKIVHGCLRQQTIGKLRASWILLRDLWGGKCHLLTTRPEYPVKVTQVQRDGRDFMIFEVEIKWPG